MKVPSITEHMRILFRMWKARMYAKPEEVERIFETIIQRNHIFCVSLCMIWEILWVDLVLI